MEGVLEGLCSAIGLMHGHCGQLLEDAELARGLLQLWDGVCCLLSAQAKPSHWLQQLLKALKLFEPEARTAAAGHVLVSYNLPGDEHAGFEAAFAQTSGLHRAYTFFMVLHVLLQAFAQSQV